MNLFLILSVLAALMAGVTFGMGLVKHATQKGHKQSWQTSIMMMTIAIVLGFIAALMDEALSLGTGFSVVGAYLVLMAIGIFIIHLMEKQENAKGHLRYAGIAFVTAVAAFAIAFLVADSDENPVREISETFGAEDAAPSEGERIPVTVASFIDGDTTRFNFDGEEASFRYLLIDTPETNHPRIGEQPFGKEASARTKEILEEASSIEVEFDVGPDQDHYDRYLAYIYADGEMVNEMLVREGLAQVKYINPPNTTHLGQLEAAQAEAEAAGRGIWSLDQPYDSEIHQEESANDTQGEDERFANCTELRRVYPDGVHAGHAAYQSRMDGNKDGHACE
ncbi:thermonuclease family protein [Salinicoccus sp. ID82-1]|uniref:thermonuclease family protein n=1 Tax=Salinicoccus sp. ID82-1 TaxID=2820269 RepID=UPI001F2FD0AA|nr:thermonuclease family protein [Salinicoccus sp. ID82-1]